MRPPLPVRGRPAATMALVIGLVLTWLVLAAATAAAPGAKLAKGRVTPASGTTATAFAFSVEFQGNGETASAVTATVASSVLPLSRTSGSATKGTWSGSSKLPAGSWQVTFRAVSSGGSNLTLSGPTVVVARPTPLPTPIPTAAPAATPKPTPLAVPTAIPVSASTPTPVPTPAPFGTTIADPSDASGVSAASATGSGGPSPSPGAGGAPSSKGPMRVPVEGVVAIGLLGAVTIAAVSAEQRRRRALTVTDAVDASEPEEPPLDEDTLATIEYAPLLDDLDEDLADPLEEPLEEPPADPSAEPPTEPPTGKPT